MLIGRHHLKSKNAGPPCFQDIHSELINCGKWLDRVLVLIAEQIHSEHE